MDAKKGATKLLPRRQRRLQSEQSENHSGHHDDRDGRWMPWFFQNVHFWRQSAYKVNTMWNTIFRPGSNLPRTL